MFYSASLKGRSRTCKHMCRRISAARRRRRRQALHSPRPQYHCSKARTHARTLTHGLRGGRRRACAVESPVLHLRSPQFFSQVVDGQLHLRRLRLVLVAQLCALRVHQTGLVFGLQQVMRAVGKTLERGCEGGSLVLVVVHHQPCPHCSKRGGTDGRTHTQQARRTRNFTPTHKMHTGHTLPLAQNARLHAGRRWPGRAG